MSDAAFLAVIIGVTLLAALVIPQLLLRRAVPQVISILREHGATSAATAVRADEVGLAAQSIWERALKRRDYKPKALMGLVQLGVVEISDDGGVYLDEAALAASVFKDL